MAHNQLGGSFEPGRPLPLEIKREELVDFYNAGYSLNEVSRTTLSYEQKNCRPTAEQSMNIYEYISGDGEAQRQS